MTDKDDILDKIESDIERLFEERQSEEFIPGETPIRLSRPTFGAPEVLESLDSLLSTWVTMGEKVFNFEEQWANYVGTEYATMVNSGSSANLLALKALEGSKIEPGDEVIVPAVSWSTSIFPIVDINATPVLVDVDEDSYTIDVDEFKNAITEKTQAVVLVHLLGNPCNMEPILEICEDHGIAVIEDCCEAHGAKYQGQKVGSFGDLGTFSFFFSHHISTIEGGMITTDSDQLVEQNKMSRAHGWVRELEDQESYSEAHPEIDPRFLFVSQGYNLRPTEIQGAFGQHQLDRLEPFIEKRRENAFYLNNHLERYDSLQLLHERDETRCSYFAYPLLLTDQASFEMRELQNHLEDNKIETRPILAGNLARQPALDQIDHRISGSLESAERLHSDGIFLGNHHGLTEEKLKYIVDIIAEFIKND